MSKNAARAARASHVNEGTGGRHSDRSSCGPRHVDVILARCWNEGEGSRLGGGERGGGGGGERR